MQKNEWSRNVVVGVVVSLIFFGWWLRGFLYSNWHFRLFSRRSWSFVADEFKSGWMLNATSDWIFLLTLLLAIPLFLYLWYLCTKVRWRRTIKKIYKAIVSFFKKIYKNLFKKSRKRSLLLAPAPPAPPIVKKNTASPARPKAIVSQGTSVGRVQPATASVDEPLSFSPTFAAENSRSPIFDMPSMENMPEPTVSPMDMEALADTPLDEIELPKRQPVVEDIVALFKENGYQLIENVQTQSQKIDFLAVSAKEILVCLIDSEPGDWLAEEEPFNGEAPLWFSELDHRVSPIYHLRESVTELKNKIKTTYPDIAVKAFMIEKKGNIINTEEMLHIWHELNVVVCRTDVGGTDDLPLLKEALQSVEVPSPDMINALEKLVKEEKNG